MIFSQCAIEDTIGRSKIYSNVVKCLSRPHFKASCLLGKFQGEIGCVVCQYNARMLATIDYLNLKQHISKNSYAIYQNQEWSFLWPCATGNHRLVTFLEKHDCECVITFI